MKENRPVQVMKNIIDSWGNKKDISPAWAATEAMKIIKADHLQKEKDENSHTLYFLAHLQFRQIARNLCSKLFEDKDDTGTTEKENSFFPPTLQPRYPVQRKNGDDPRYRLREHMTEDDYIYNIKRMRAEGKAKVEHADLLEDERKNRFPKRQRFPKRVGGLA